MRTPPPRRGVEWSSDDEMPFVNGDGHLDEYAKGGPPRRVRKKPIGFNAVFPPPKKPVAKRHKRR